MVRIRTVTPAGGFTLRLGLSDGREKVIDILPFLKGPIFEPLRQDPSLFARVSVDEELGTIVWPNGADICPDVLIHDRQPASLEVPSKP